MTGWRPTPVGWRFWGFAGLLLVISVADMLAPPDIALMVFLVVPVVGSAVLGSPRQTGLLTLLAVALGMLSSVGNDYSAELATRSLVVIAVVGVASILLARVVQREAAGREELRRRYLLLAENASDVVYSADLDGAVTWVSPAVGDALGWSPEELIGTHMADLVHPDDRDLAETGRARVSAGRAAEPLVDGFIARMRTKDDGYRWGANKVTVQIGADGAPVGLVTGVSMVDMVVAERERAEAERERAEAEELRLQATLRSLLDPHVLLQAVRDDEGTITDFAFADVNDAACKYMQMSREQLTGARLLDLLPGHAGSGMLAMYADAVESGIPLELDDYPYAHEIQKAELWFDVRAVRIGDGLNFTWRDVTDRHETARLIAESQERYRLLAENSTDVVVLVRDGIVEWVSPSLTSALGWRVEDWIGHGYVGFVHPDDVVQAQAMATEVKGGAVRVATRRVRAQDGRYHWVEVHAGPFTGTVGQPDAIVTTFRVTDNEVAAHRELQRRATYDDLTGVLKRKAALAHLTAISGHVRRAGQESAILFCDIDNFKKINDQHGHSAGDQVLRVFAQRIQSSVRTTDTVARMGGDEFLVVLSGVHHLAEAAAIAEKIRTTASEPVEVPNGTVRATLSIGVTLSVPNESPDEMVERADKAMYDAKDAGRNRVITITSPFASGSHPLAS